MIALNGKPLLEYNLERVCVSDITDIVMVVGYKAEDIINRYGISFQNKKITYVIQREQKGLVHAMECAKNQLAGDDFILLLGDEMLRNARTRKMIQFYHENQPLFGICGILKVDNRNQIRNTYALIKNEDDQLLRLIEKPRNPFNNFQGTGHCIFNNTILDYIERTPIHHERKEKELPDLVQCCIDEGNVIKAFFICDDYANINSIQDLRDVEKWEGM